MNLSHQVKPVEVTIFSQWSDMTEDAQQSERSLTTFNKKGQLLKVEVDGVIVGYIIEQVIKPEAELIQILMAQDYQKKGYATKALALWIDQLKRNGVNSVFLEVREGNFPAKNLYKRLGFNCVGLRADYYQYKGQNEDALLLMLEI